MRASFVVFALAALVAADPVPGGVSSAISPQSSPPPGCSGNYKGSFQISPVNVSSSSRRSLEPISLEQRQNHNVLTISLSGGILTDSQGRTGYVASNSQFQFDDPPQAGAIYTAGFSVCGNGRLAIGSDTTWEKCLSGPGSTNGGFFYNLYLKNDGGQCIESYILARPYGSGSGPIPVSGSGSSATTPAGSSTPPTTSASSSSSPSSSTVAAGNSSSTLVSSTTGKVSNGTATASSASGTTTKKHTGGVVTSQRTITQTPTGQPTGGAASSSSATGGTGAGGSPTGGAPAASSSTAGNAAATLGLRTEVFGLAAGILAYAVL